MINKKKLAAGLLAVGMLCSLSGCDYSYFMVEKTTYNANQSGSGEDEDNSYIYVNQYQDLSLHFPASWEVVEDKSAYLKAASPSGTTLEITRKSGKAAVTVLPFPTEKGQTSSVMEIQYAPLAQTAEDGTTVTMQGEVSQFESNSLTFDEDHVGSSYRFLVKRADGRIDEFIGVKLGDTAYTLVISADSSHEQELQEMDEMLSKMEFVNNPELTAVFLNGKTGIETIDVTELQSQNTVTCIASVNVRNAPNSQTSQVIGSLKSGDRIVVTGEEGSWYQFEYEGKTAYVYKEYFE